MVFDLNGKKIDEILQFLAEFAVLFCDEIKFKHD
jgi:hypothetical protein